jgi:fructokinase
MLTRSLELATVVKFNSHELAVVAEMLGLHGSGEDALCRRLIERCGLTLVAVTRGAEGSSLFSEGGTVEHPGYSAPVVDTIGCGDAFAAALAHCVYRGLSLEAASEAANRLGAWVATHSGATPRATPQTVEGILRG